MEALAKVLHNAHKSTSITFTIFWIGVAMLAVGAWGTSEDLISTRYGIELAGTVVAQPITMEIGYWLVGFFLWGGSVLSLIAFMTDRQVFWWAFVTFILFQAFDISTDYVYRVGGDMSFAPMQVLFGMGFTLLYTFILSELAFSLGVVIVIEFWVDGIAMTKQYASMFFTSVLEILIESITGINNTIKRVLSGTKKQQQRPAVPGIRPPTRDEDDDEMFRKPSPTMYTSGKKK